jgi:hydrogenase expression/formation protein HypC
MCLAIPGKVLTVDRTAEPAMGDVSFGGVSKKICLEWLPDVQVGDYVIVHVGFAISKLDEQEALETLKLFEEISGALDELGEEGNDAEIPRTKKDHPRDEERGTTGGA